MKANTSILSILAITLAVPSISFGMGKGPVSYIQANGQSQSQFTAAQDKTGGYLMVRGHAAEILFMNIHVKPEPSSSNAAVLLGKSTKQTDRNGSVVSCSEISKQGKAEYACSVKVVDGNSFTAYREPFNWKTFNFAWNYGGTNLFKGKTPAPSRAIASVGEDAGPQSNGNAEAYFVKPKDPDHKKTKVDKILVLVKGGAAQKLYDVMATAKSTHAFTKGNGEGYRGDSFACVHTKNEKASSTNVRCSFTVALDDGNTVKEFNPLFN